MNATNGSGHSTALATRDAQTPKILVRTEDSFRLGLEPSSFTELMPVATAAATMKLGGVKSVDEALMRIMRGRSVGLTAIQSLEYVFVINGRTGVDAMILRGLAMQHPECEKFYFEESSSDSCTVVAQRRGQPEQRFTWTVDDAKRAKLADKDNWVGYRAQMLRARASTDAVKAVFPDAAAGMTSREEIVDTHGVTVEETTRPLPAARDLAAELIQAVADSPTPDDLKGIWKRAIAAEKSGSLTRPQKEAIAAAMKSRASALTATAPSATASAPAAQRTVDTDGVVTDPADDLGGRL